MDMFDRIMVLAIVVCVCLLTHIITVHEGRRFTCEQMGKAYVEGRCVVVKEVEYVSE